ncbi:tyrosine-type recombinase/integrase [Kibdelosporangium lantanae]|uniref:Tyrosine-type recombinase/integrase n=1 Tax=Kibdelosporangium lantanae TaxID=1497396 RepID=A0ABW3MAH7_9PSEU
MGHIQDRWYRQVPDPDHPGKKKREKTSLYGTGNRYKVRYIDPDGEEKSRTFPDKCKSQAEAFLVSVESDKLEGRYVNPNAGKITFKDHAESWLKGQSSDAATRQTLTSRLRSQLYPFFGKKPISSITPAVVRDWLGHMQEKNLEKRYQALLFDSLSSIMNAAVEDKRIRSNPCKARSVKKPRPENRKVIGEILAFSPDDVDRSAMTVNLVRQIRVVSRTLVFAPPKGGKTRTIPLPQGVLDEIDAHVDTFGITQVTLPWLQPAGRPTTASLMVIREDGRPWYGDLYTKVVWKSAFKRAGVEYRDRVDGMHAMRHMYASVLLAQGVSVKELAEYLGHADASITLETYTHLMPSSYDRARKAVNAVFHPRTDDRSETA